MEKEWSVSIRSLRRTFRGSWEGEGMTGGEVPTAAEAAARRSSLARGFPVRKAAKLGSDSCSRRRGSYWGGRIGWKRAEVEVRRRQKLTGEEGNDGEVVPVVVRPREVAWKRQ
jgi:hypothetical protein